MSKTTRSKREELIAKDDGDPGETVAVSLQGKNGSQRAYHELDCVQLPDNHRKQTRAEAKARGRAPGRCCILVDDTPPNRLSECPRCGTLVKRTAHHIRQGECDP